MACVGGAAKPAGGGDGAAPALRVEAPHGKSRA
jgi:hypothetical protein